MANPVKLSSNTEKLVHFLNVLRIDVFSFTFWFAFAIPMITTVQVVQDKICLNQERLSTITCAHIQDSAFVQSQNQIYIKSNIYDALEVFLTHLPAVLITLFLGKWIDLYPEYIKYVLAAPAFGLFLRAVLAIYNCFLFQSDYMWMLSAHLPYAFSGGSAACYSGLYNYITRKSTEKSRVIRFGTIEFTRSLGSLVLGQKPWLNHQLRNYIGVYAISGSAALFSTVWALFMLNDIPVSSVEKNCQLDVQKSKFAQLLDVRNVLEMFKTCAKKREDGVHVRLWHLMASALLVFFFTRGIEVISFQYTEKVYQWDEARLSNALAFARLLQGATAILLPSFFIHRLHFDDYIIGILGCTFIIFEGLILGAVVHPISFFISQVLECFGKLSQVAFRSFISKIIHQSECGQVLTALACLELTTPILASLVFSLIFNTTIDSYPSIVYHVVSIIMFYPFLMMLWMDLTRKKVVKSQAMTCTSTNLEQSKSVCQDESGSSVQIF